MIINLDCNLEEIKNEFKCWFNLERQKYDFMVKDFRIIASNKKLKQHR